MDVAGTQQLDSPRQVAWDILLDPVRLARCAAAIERVERIDDRTARLSARARLGFLSVGITIDLVVVEATAPDDATVRAHASAPGAGVDATARLRLSGPPEGPTSVDWSADFELSGMLAGLDPRRVGDKVGEVVGEAFECVRRQLREPVAGAS